MPGLAAGWRHNNKPFNTLPRRIPSRVPTIPAFARRGVTEVAAGEVGCSGGHDAGVQFLISAVCPFLVIVL